MPENDRNNCGNLDFEGAVACSSDEFDVTLDIQPKKISVPSVVKFTVTNHMELPYRFTPNNNPVVFTEGENSWEKFPLAGGLRVSENETVANSYSFKKEIPYSNWNPDPGRYLLLIHGQVLEGETKHKVNITGKIEVV